MLRPDYAVCGCAPSEKTACYSLAVGNVMMSIGLLTTSCRSMTNSTAKGSPRV